jgi:hypothetical protein
MLDQTPARIGQRLARGELTALLAQVTDAGAVITAEILAEARRLYDLDLLFARHFVGAGAGWTQHNVSARSEPGG